MKKEGNTQWYNFSDGKVVALVKPTVAGATIVHRYTISKNEDGKEVLRVLHQPTKNASCDFSDAFIDLFGDILKTGEATECQEPASFEELYKLHLQKANDVRDRRPRSGLKSEFA